MLPAVIKYCCDGFSLSFAVAQFSYDHGGHRLWGYLGVPWFVPLLWEACAGCVCWNFFQASHHPISQYVHHCQDMGTLSRYPENTHTHTHTHTRTHKHTRTHIYVLGFSQCDSCFLGDHPKPNASTGGG